MSGPTRERAAPGDDGARPGRLSGTGRVLSLVALALYIAIALFYAVVSQGRGGATGAEAAPDAGG